MSKFRIEEDSLGSVKVPIDALYGAQTQRAVHNFCIGHELVPRELIYALAEIKGASAQANAELNLLSSEVAEAIKNAAGMVLSGDLDQEFPVALFQTGSGTSTNMNLNEVLSNLASKSHGQPIHPNDQVNLGQSSNDVFPAAIQIATAKKILLEVMPSLEHLALEIEKLAEQNSDVIKTGRTHLMDAVPLTVKQELDTWVFQIREHCTRFSASIQRMGELPIGGTAVGTGLNTHSDFGVKVCRRLSIDQLEFTPCKNLASRIAGQEVGHEISALFEGVAITLSKICNDLRWMNSGPINGLGEIRLPELQPGSSIMPGKVNPVIPEAVLMAMTQVMGYHLSTTVAAQSGNFQLNVMLPLIGANLINSADLIASSAIHLADKSFVGMDINRSEIEQRSNLNPILVTALNPLIGHKKAAEIVKIAIEEKRSIIDVAEEITDIGRTELEILLSARSMT